MKEFCDTLKQTGRVTGGNVYFGVAWAVLMFVIGMIGDLICYYRDGVWCEMAGVMTFTFSIVMIVFVSILIFPADFIQALSMGKARKYLFPAHYCMWLLNGLLVLLAVLGMEILENVIGTHLVEDGNYILNEMAFLYNPMIFITIVLCIPAGILFLGGLRLFFGLKLLWGQLGLFVICIVLNKAKEKYPDAAIMKWQESLAGTEPGAASMCLLCLIGAVLLLFFAWLMLRKQRVTFG